MAQLRTMATQADVTAFLNAAEPAQRAADGHALAAMMARVSGEAPHMWGPSIVGFGSYAYRYDSGHGGTMCRIGFSPRKAQLVLYFPLDAEGQDERLARLGKHKRGKGCLYVGKLADVDQAILEEMVDAGWRDMARRYPPVE